MQIVYGRFVKSLQGHIGPHSQKVVEVQWSRMATTRKNERNNTGQGTDGPAECYTPLGNTPEKNKFHVQDRVVEHRSIVHQEPLHKYVLLDRHPKNIYALREVVTSS